MKNENLSKLVATFWDPTKEVLYHIHGTLVYKNEVTVQLISHKFFKPL
jgi:hypothetical protein